MKQTYNVNYLPIDLNNPPEFYEVDMNSFRYMDFELKLARMYRIVNGIDPCSYMTKSQLDDWNKFKEKEKTNLKIPVIVPGTDGKRAHVIVYVLRGQSFIQRVTKRNTDFLRYYHNQKKFYCKSCTHLYPLSCSPKSYRGKVCRKCVTRLYRKIRCQCCNHLTHKKDILRASFIVKKLKEWTSEAKSVCISCAEDSYVCRRCNLYFTENEAGFVRDTLHICGHCASVHNPYCMSCHLPSGDWTEFCERCEAIHAVRPYSYNMSLVFHKSAKDFGKDRDIRFYGCELEVTSNVMNFDNGVKYLNNFLKQNKFGVLKKDSSAGRNLGVEINFQPMTYHKIMEELNKKDGKIFGMLEHIRSLGWLSHYCQKNDPDAICGMHVHLSLNKNAKALDRSKMFRIKRFIAKNKEWIRVISQRTEVARNKYCNPDHENQTMVYRIRNWQAGDTKHVPVNIQKNTMEFRLFNGTLLPSRFRKNVQFVDAIYEFCSMYISTDIRDFENYVNLNRNKYRDLIDYMDNNLKSSNLEIERVA